MKYRFAVFECEQYYPNGGWRDLRSLHQTWTEVESLFKGWQGCLGGVHVVDLETGKIVLGRDEHMDEILEDPVAKRAREQE